MIFALEKSIKMNTKVAICLILPCIIALVSCAYLPGNYGYQQPRQVAPYANYAANSYQGLKQARLFNYREYFEAIFRLFTRKLYI